MEENQGNPVEQNNEKNEIMIPKSRFDEVIVQKNQFKEKLETFEREQLQSRNNKLVEDNKFKELYEGLKTQNEELLKNIDIYKPSHDQWTVYQTKRKESLLEKIPENKRAKFKDVTDLNILEEMAEVFTAGVATTNKRKGITGVSAGKFDGYNGPQDMAVKDPKLFKEVRHLPEFAQWVRSQSWL
jgi:hypothetical protein